MSNQQQQYPHSLPRHPLNINSLDTNTSLLLSQQPLSPTHATTSNHQSVIRHQMQDSRQKQLKGMPQLVGLSTIEYTCDDRLTYTLTEITQTDIAQNYLKQLYEECSLDQNVSKVNEQFYKIEVVVTMPYEMEIEQIEININNTDMVNKYLKVLRVDKNTEEEQSQVKLYSGLIDASKKVIELNTCGVSQQVKITFLCKKSIKSLIIKDTKTVTVQSIISSTQQVSDKIKNEIIPLLNNNDVDIDELDDEVAMISNKLGKDILNTDDIKIEIQSDRQKQQTLDQEGRNFNTLNQPNDEDPNNTRNFNSLPRNYTDSQAKRDQADNLELSADNWYIKLLNMCFSNIKIIGFNFNCIPAITCMTTFMNHSFQLKKEKLLNDAYEIDFLMGVQLIANKRYTQATEIFRKIQAHYFRVIDEHQRFIQSTSNKQSSKQLQTQISLKKFQMNKLFLKSALLELLIAESMCLNTQINEKLLSLKRMVDLSQGKLAPSMTFSPQIFIADDPYTTITRQIPQMLKFILMCMAHKKEIVKLSALKAIEFILETLGCSLDAAIVLILKAIIKTYPFISQQTSTSVQNKPIQHQDSFCNTAMSSVSDYFASPRPSEGSNNQIQLKSKLVCATKPEQFMLIPNEFSSIKEPNSGFNTALKNAYNHVLDTYISVLSSISSHILHQLFYEILIPTLVQQPLQNNQAAVAEIKQFTIKIAEKIITICQGDLILNKETLDSLLQCVTIKTPQNESFQTAMKNLWNNIRSKVFTNYSSKGLRTLIEWVVEKLSVLAQSGQLENASVDASSDIAKLEISETELQQLSQMLDIVSLISIGRKKNEEEANSLIKIKQEYCVDLYLLINPLLFWLDFSVEREERLNLFKQVYQTIKDVLDNLPPKRVDIDILQIMIPILQRTTDYLKNNSPSLSMMKFLDIVLGDVKQGNFSQSNPDLQYFFLDMLNNFVGYLSYCLYDNAFSVFDKLLSMCQDVINEKVVTKCINALVDKYTMKSKPQKNSLTQFMKCLMEVKVRNHSNKKLMSHNNNNNLETDTLNDLDDEELSIHSKNNYFDILCEFCFFANEDVDLGKVKQYQQEFRNPIDVHDMYIDRLQFFIDSLSMLNELHVNIFTSLIAHPKFKTTLLGLLSKGETSLRLKCHEILEVITNYYSQYCTSKTVYELAVPTGDKDAKRKTQNEVMEVEFINHERLYISQIVVQCVRASLEQKHDSYLQFNSLILLDFLFQNLLPVPTYQNEQLKGRRPNKSNQNQSTIKTSETVLDIETLEINEETPEFEVTEQQYINLRLNLVFKLWPYIQTALNSAWSNIRSICYGLICSMLKIDIRDYQPTNGQATGIQTTFLNKLKQIVLPMLMSLLSSKESESKAGGLNILGSFCGLSYDFSKVKISKNLEFFKKNSNFISLAIWQLVFDLQDDWDITIKEASVVLIQLCAPRDAVKYFDKVKKEKESIRLTTLLNKFGMAPGQPFHSQQSSRSQIYLNSNPSDQNDENIIAQDTAQKKHSNNILSFLSASDELSMIMQMDQQYPGLSNELFAQTPGSNLKLSSTRQKQRVISDSQTSEEANDHKKIMDYDMEGTFPNEIENFDLQATETMEQFHFFVDEYQDEQIQEIISIFRNDFKPPKNLWIEKNPTSFNQPDYYQEIYSSAIEQFNQQQLQLQQKQQQEMQLQVSGSPKGSNKLLDSLEDDLLSSQSQTAPKDNYMIFERHFEDEKEEQTQEQQQMDNNNLDAEPYKFLDEEQQPKVQQPKKTSALQIIDEDEMIDANISGDPRQVEKDSLETSQPLDQIKLQDITIKNDQQIKNLKVKDKKTTDDLIEEYERKINNTILLLEEEKKKVQGKKKLEDTLDLIAPTSTIESNAKSTPEFKSKKDVSNTKILEAINVNMSPKDYTHKNAKKQAQLYLAELSKGQLSNLDNMKLMKQINQVFNDNSLNLGYSVHSTKAKLNKSYENLLAANKNYSKQNAELLKTKKNLSSSPKRATSSSKKGSKSVGQTKRKQDVTGKVGAKAMCNLRDLNYFIKTIEKDLSDKFNKLNMKDFNSMPTTPTSILKKMEEQVKAINDNKKAYMSNTCPNIAQVLSQINDDGNKSSTQTTKVMQTTNVTPSNVSYISNNNQNQQSQFGKLSFSKTQKIDFKDAMKSMLSREGQTNRESSNEGKKVKLSPHRDERQQYANLLNAKKVGQKKSRGSLDKYSSNQSNGSKLNKSANMINPGVQGKKPQLNKSMVNSQPGEMVRSSQKSVHQLLLSKITSQGPTVHQTPATLQQCTFSTSQGFDYENSAESMVRKHFEQHKTPNKFNGSSKQGGGYSEIIELSPTSGEKPRHLIL